jgi:hypothetical protein
MFQGNGYRLACLRAAVALMAVVMARPAPALSGELTEARAGELHELLTPDPDAVWRTIPWMTSVLEAQREALEKGRPIFIWAMDGHPLGCV